ncbi:tRNA (uracil-O(2)-)-methyltransferase [Biomphalaria glabrata]|nr:tRNA (uracil-O(2)-)-methyltransferase [Biomphalaria glabrata]
MDSPLELFTTCENCKKQQHTKGSQQLFLKAVSVWINKPHVVNRRLCGSKIVHVYRVQTTSELLEILQKINDNSHTHAKSANIGLDLDLDLNLDLEGNEQSLDLSDEVHPFIIILRELIPKSEFFPKLFEAVIFDKERLIISFLALSQDCNEVVKSTTELSYSIQFKSINKDLPGWAAGNEMVLYWSCDHSETKESPRQMTSIWLQSVLLDKLVIWSHINDISISLRSLKLVSIDAYKDTYIRLKNTYGRDLVKNWTERTDPKKFVYEDVAIAAYLLLIWEDERKKKNLTKKQSFVDLGCGNGLLVYILTKEGYRGLGIDLRKRNIWDTFGTDIDLRVETISPSADHLYPDFDWLIGNHSDELTPWIPVIAARSSYECSFFVIPCCHHDFVGKFGVSEKGKSRYESYLDYVKEIISHCGFVPESDSLRIPSTKRICFIGRTRTYTKENEASKDIERQAFIDKRTTHSQALMMHRQKYSHLPTKTIETTAHGLHAADLSSLEKDLGVQLKDKSPSLEIKDLSENSCLDKRKCLDFEDTSSLDCKEACLKRFRADSASCKESVECDIETDCAEKFESLATTNQMQEKAKQWASEFQPRAAEQKVRNCQAVPEDVKKSIVNTVFKLVLEAPDATCVQLDSGRSWKKGGSITLNSIVDHLDKSTLVSLKSECGGLQTLLRNHSYIFQVTGGRVQLRDFTQPNPWLGRNPNKLKRKQRMQPGDKKKTTLCWFHIHHPEGCPLPSEDCQFAHSETELKTKTASSN